MSGGSLVTKGLISGGATPTADTSTALPPAVFAYDASTSNQDVVIVIPTAINMTLMAAENITDNLRAGQAASFSVPSLYKRAFLVAHEADEIALVKE
jgi:hypothetical protein